MNKQENKVEDEPEVEPYHDEGEIVINPKIEMRGHQWRQQGFSIICRSCSLRHSYYIGPELLLTAIEDGVPKFVKRVG